MAPPPRLRARITQRQDFTAALWSIRLAPEKPVPFAPGQYLTLGVEVDGKVVERAYSPVSAPQEAEIELFLEDVPEGALSPRLHALKPGDELLLRPQARGHLKLDPGVRRHALVCTTTGVAPFVSMLRAGVEGQRVLLLHAAETRAELGYERELQELAARHPWLTYVPTLSSDLPDAGWTGERGRAEDVLRKHLDAGGFVPGEAALYFAGHPALIEAGKGIALRRGFDRERIKVEAYWMPPTKR